MANTNSFIDKYLDWLRQNTSALELENDIVEITSPFLDRHNDYIQIYIKKDGKNYTLTDDGYTISDLELSGMSFNTPKRKEQLNCILSGFGISLDNDNLCCTCSPSDFPAKKHDLIQAILATNDLFVLSQPSILSFFLQDVEFFLKNNSIAFIKNIKLPGKSGFDHAYDFGLPSHNTMPERYIKVINNFNKSATESIIFAWSDTIPNRDPNTKLYTFINDTDKEPSNSCIEALNKYDICPVPWSSRINVVDKLRTSA